MKLKLKAYTLYWSITALIALPVTLLVVIMLLVYPLKWVRDSFGMGLAMLCADMIEWRRDTVYWYVTNERRGYSLEI